MGEHLDIRAFFDDSHSEGAKVANLSLFDEGGTCAQDGLVEMLGSGKSVLERFDALIQVSLILKQSMSRNLNLLLKSIIRLPESAHPLFTLCFAIFINQLSLLAPSTVPLPQRIACCHARLSHLKDRADYYAHVLCA